MKGHKGKNKEPGYIFLIELSMLLTKLWDDEKNEVVKLKLMITCAFNTVIKDDMIRMIFVKNMN